MNKLAILIFLIIGSASLTAQSNIIVRPDADVSKLLNAFVQANAAQNRVEGWRVQILATTDRQRLETVQSNFKLNYPSIPVDWVHNKPYFKLRAGAFQTKQEAERLKYTLGRQFDGVYLVKARVSEDELLRMY
ncbi:MAG: SPOR domain-containing protein [Bacteroidota bacterium]